MAMLAPGLLAFDSEREKREMHRACCVLWMIENVQDLSSYTGDRKNKSLECFSDIIYSR